MKRLLCCLALCCGIFAAAMPASGQAMMASKPKGPASPPAMAVSVIGNKSFWIAYSSPGVKGRAGKIFTSDGLIKTAGGSQYPIWRAGANSATTLIVDGKVKIGDVTVPSGAYTLFADISDQNNWTLIISKKTGQWGIPYNEDSEKANELARVDLKKSTLDKTVDQFTMAIETEAGGGLLKMSWENTQYSIPFTVKK